jgi:acetyl-CoA synthetase
VRYRWRAEENNMSEKIVSRLKEERTFEPSEHFRARARLGSAAAYRAMHRASLEDPEAFWRENSQDLVWRTPWTSFSEWQPASEDGKTGAKAKFFVGGSLNITETCLDRHLATSARMRAAIVWEGEPGETRTLTYFDLHREVVRVAAALLDMGVAEGDRVGIYMGMVPEAAVAMLACARIGATHSVVFGGFSAEALRDRMNDCGAKVLLTQDGAFRRGSIVPLKAMADDALAQAETIEKVVVVRRIGAVDAPIAMKEGRDVYWDDLAPSAPSLARAKSPQAFDAEHPLFILYTSGSTGKPKGVLHTTGGYLAAVNLSTKFIFDIQDTDLYWCTADVGWVTGHSYFVYGPLSVGASCMMYEGAPNHPDPGRFWRIIERHGVSIFYTAPTAIRAFIRWGDEHVAKSDLSRW